MSAFMCGMCVAIAICKAKNGYVFGGAVTGTLYFAIAWYGSLQ